MEEQNKQSTVLKAVGIITLGAVMVFAILQQRFLPSKDVITVTGIGKVPYKPDTAFLRISVVALRTDQPENATQQAREKINKINKALDELQIPAENRQISAYAFDPQFESSDSYVPTDGKEPEKEPSQKSKEPKLDGYNSFQEMTVKIDNIDKDTQIIDQVVERVTKEGAVKIGLVSMFDSNIEEKIEKAKQKAIEDAKLRAQEIATKMGIKLGKIKGFSQESIENPEEVYSYGDSDVYFDGQNNNIISNFKSSSVKAMIIAKENIDFELK